MLVTVGAKAVRDELEVFLQIFAEPSFADELDKPFCGVVRKPDEFSDGYDAIRVSREGLVLADVEALVAVVGIDQT